MAVIGGTAGNDRLVGTADADGLYGNDGDDALFGRDGNDTLGGGEGNDRLDGGAGADTMSGGSGNDSYVVDDVGDTVLEVAGAGTDTVTVRAATYTLAAGIEVERLVAGAGTLAISLYGNSHSRQIYGNDGINTLAAFGAATNLYGRGGADTLIGSAFDDVLDGGTGADTMTGGFGDDIYFVDNAGDIVTELSGQGTDRVVASVSYTLQATTSVEQLYSRGTGAINLTGSDADNTIVANNAANVLAGGGGDDRITARDGNDTLLGGEGNDTLIGGTGADAMTGGAGDDIFYVDDAGDTVFEAAGGGNDTVYVEADWTLGAGQAVETLIARGSTAIDLTGNDLGNTIHGNAGVNILRGGGGDDTIHGGVGDTLDGGDGADTFVVTGGTPGQITIRGGPGDTLVNAETGWAFLGTAVIDGVAMGRWENGTTTLLVERGVDTSGLDVVPDYGAAVTNGGITRQVIDLAALPSGRGIVVGGNASGDGLGRSVSAAGDVNGDGFDDFILGAPFSGAGTTDIGEAYLVFGGNAPQLPSVSLLTPDLGFVIEGPDIYDSAGFSVSSAGDVNGDGYDDLIVGAPYNDGAAATSGAAYVVFGGPENLIPNIGGHQIIRLNTLSPAQGFVIPGEFASDQAGRNVASAGDVNGDGFDDIIVGAPFADGNGNNSGGAYVIFGRAGSFGTQLGGRQVVDLPGLGQADGFILKAAFSGGRLGWSTLAAGDVNGDGLADVMIGAPYASNGAGEAYVVFGTRGVFGGYDNGRFVVELESLLPHQGLVLRTANAGELVGSSVSAGDLNGDGYADMIVGAKGDSLGRTYAGATYVVFGHAYGFGGIDGNGRQVVNLDTMTADRGFIIYGERDEDRQGQAVSNAGDINGDGFNDLLIGAPMGAEGGVEGGLAYVVFGGADGFGTEVGGRQIVDLASLSAADGFIIKAGAGNDQLGRSVSAAGDVNGDGFADLLVGAPNASGTGAAYVILGGPTGLSLPQVTGSTDGDDTLAGTSGAERLIGGRGNDTLTGNGGADVFIGGSGDDIIDIGTGNFFRIDGGTGTDTLVTTGDLDLTRIDDVMIRGIEIIDVTGAGTQRLTLDALDVVALAPTNRDQLAFAPFDKVVFLKGDGSDTVHLTGLTAMGMPYTLGGEDYQLYLTAGDALLAVDTDFNLV